MEIVLEFCMVGFSMQLIFISIMQLFAIYSKSKRQEEKY